jgi:hypothetical protein
MPALLESAPTAGSLCKLWYSSFSRGYYLPALCAASGAAYLYAAGHRYNRGDEYRGFLVGGILVAGIIPYTKVAIFPVIDLLSVAAKNGAASMSMEEARRLVGLWTTRSVVRSFMTAAGAILGMWNLINMLEA